MYNDKSDQCNIYPLMLFYITCKCLDHDDDDDDVKMKRVLVISIAIAVSAAVTAAVLLVAGSVLSTQNG